MSKEKFKKNPHRATFNLILGIFVCLLLCSLEVVLYFIKVPVKYATKIIGGVILFLLMLDIGNYIIKKVNKK